jgi:hypothetical protein
VIADVLAEDLMETSDEDILSEAAEDYEDVGVVVRRADELIERAILEARKRRMQRAKAAMHNALCAALGQDDLAHYTDVMALFDRAIMLAMRDA